MMTAPTGRSRWWFLAALTALVALTALTRLQAPWRLPVTNDEMKHLESWRNRYRTDDVYPLFLEKLESGHWSTAAWVDQARRFYALGSLAQRALLVLVDGHPPAHPVLAEIIEAATRSNLAASRLPSAIASAIAVLLMFRLGRMLRDDALGIAMATLLSVGFLAQMYAGISRSYAMAQLAVVLALLVFLREQLSPSPSPWRCWLSAIFAQSLHWFTWFIVGPLVLIELVRRLRGGASPRRLAAQTWWYAALSVALLPLLYVHMTNPSIMRLDPSQPVLLMWRQISLASPFAAIDLLLDLPVFGALSPAALGFILLGILGVAAVLADSSFVRDQAGAALVQPSVRLTLMLVLVVSVVAPAAFFSGSRFMMIYAVAPTIFAAIGLRWLLRGERLTCIVCTATLALGLVQAIGFPQNPHDSILWAETDYPAVAKQIERSLQPGDVWCAFPYFWGDCLYPYAALPEPVRPLDQKAFNDFVRTLPRPDAAVIIFSRIDMIEPHRVLRRAAERRSYSNGFEVVRVEPRPR